MPKKADARYAKDYRPIACCTTLYKIISKVITHRLHQVIGEVINQAQSGFIPGRHIADNIILATELIRGYGRSHISPRCVIKVDIRKAYDSVEWSFLEGMLWELGFPHKCISWIMACVQSASYSLLIDGTPTKPFKAKKGIRQGDPLSPFLFAICMEYLSRCLGRLKLNPDFNFHPKCEKIHLTHLMFADDLLLFARADMSSIVKIMAAFQNLSQASGLAASVDKSCLYVAGVSQIEAVQLADAIQLPVGDLPFKYLGIPLTSRKLSFAQCKRLIEKIIERAQSWMAHLLSYAGRMQLIRAILSSMQNYWAHIFPLSKKVIKAVERICCRFLWTGETNPSHKAPVAWSQFYKPKRAGGWNLIDMKIWNKAAILKLLWALAFKTDKLWVRWVNAYYIKRGNIHSVTITSNTSWLLRKMIDSKDLLMDLGGWDNILQQGKYSIKAVYRMLV